MHLTRENFRAMIFYDFKSALSPKQSFERLRTAFGNEAPSVRSVYSWYSEFKCNRVSLSDELREGRPITAATDENVAAVRQMIEEDNRVTYQIIRSTLGIGMTAINNILHDHLKVRKVCCRWIPHNLTLDQKQLRVEWCKKTLKKYKDGASKAAYDIVTGDESWIYAFEPESKRQSAQWVFPTEPNPVKVKRVRSVGKKMIASFFSKSGSVANIPLEDRKTVTADWYTTICLPKVFEKVRQNRPRSNIVLHQDNASSHTAAKTKAYLKASNVELLEHPPYSPDLAPCDFFLFPRLKDKMRGLRYSSANEAVEAFENLTSQVSQEEWSSCFNDWFYRMNKCVEFNGEYFEKQ